MIYGFAIFNDDIQSVDDFEHEPKEEFLMNVYNKTRTSFLDFSHTDKRKYTCDECDYQTDRNTNLKRHKLGKHAGVKYSCQQCDGQFSTQDNLKRNWYSKHDGKE